MENTGEAIWKSFSEKGIVLAGIDGPEYQAFFQSLVRVSQTSRAGFRVLDGVENVQDGASPSPAVYKALSFVVQIFRLCESGKVWSCSTTGYKRADDKSGTANHR